MTLLFLTFEHFLTGKTGKNRKFHSKNDVIYQPLTALLIFFSENEISDIFLSLVKKLGCAMVRNIFKSVLEKF